MIQKAYKGVNLGGWLVLEKWITPSLFKVTQSNDEFSFCLEFGKEAAKKLQEHRDTFLTEADFKWISNQGLNAIRIPIGYWIFGDEPPFVGGIKYLDFAMQMAVKYELEVLIDLHAAKGSQNGWDHSGRLGDVNWHKHPTNIIQSLSVLERLAQRYANSPNLIGIELLNEPRWDVPRNILIDYYKKGYAIVRKYCSKDVAVICHDGFRIDKWHGVFPKKDFSNLILDTHLYQCMTDKDRKLDINGHIKKINSDWAKMLSMYSQEFPIMVGEWSLALDPATFKKMDEESKIKSLRSYGKAQLEQFDKSWGWFFWTLKTEEFDGWSLIKSMENDWLVI